MLQIPLFITRPSQMAVVKSCKLDLIDNILVFIALFGYSSKPNYCIQTNIDPTNIELI